MDLKRSKRQIYKNKNKTKNKKELYLGYRIKQYKIKTIPINYKLYSYNGFD